MRIVSRTLGIGGLMILAWIALDPAGRWVWLWVPFIFHAFVLYPVLAPGCAWIGPSISSFSTRKKEVWITIDDGPNPEETQRILDLLDRYAAKATFFVVGKKLKEHPDICRAIMDRGQGLENHTWSHPRFMFWSFGKRKIEREIRLCSDQIEKISGGRPSYFRPPVGHTPWGLKSILREEKLSLVLWSTRALDGLHYDRTRCLARLMGGLRPGAILLFHDGCGHGPELLEALLRRMDELGYRAVIPQAPTEPIP